MESSNELFPTGDITLASALIYHRCKLSSIETGISHHQDLFLIKRNDDFDDLLLEYFEGRMRVDPVQFFRTYTNLSIQR